MQLSLFKTPLFWFKHQQKRRWAAKSVKNVAAGANTSDALANNVSKLTWLTRKLILNRNSSTVSSTGKDLGQVVFVGAGAGDPELLTIKAVKALQQADIVLVDWLVNPEINAFIPDHIERVFVGKKCGQHSVTQAEICQLLVDYAAQGKRVVRLKGGDPSIFARLAEETDVLSKANVPFQVIPGITAATGCAAYSGIPLTHRDCAQSVKFITAHGKQEDHECDWHLLAAEQCTLVFYMGLNRVQLICQRLISHGMAATMPIAVIDQGTSHTQKVVCKSLASMDAASDLADFQGPALIIVGKVVEKRVDVNLSLVDGEAPTISANAFEAA
ncbi:uroporphyrinogen-III C-methyltransferase [Thalassotalea euphylliae]|uniref:uroporphyrinogen-III C-methyltransferase n=1 Tax=Thalassotalea euphylliae TaxID=1655234 RepID=A0A3E0UI62_9GAMM|nr:uroporphyrinogen-III C-methyltransferase [Thalassotalea euphylliae]REL35452.1 uroporphyrinogen-III C-methyltransferase [Thalassotalea euphylliae]